MAATDPVMTPDKHPTPKATPPSGPSMGDWVRENLFPDTKNAVVSVIMGGSLLIVALAAFRFTFFTARWEVIYRNVTNVLVGVFPREDLNLAWAMLFIVVLGLAFMVGAAHQLVTQSDEEVGVLARSQSTQVQNALRRFGPIVLLAVVFLWIAREERFVAAGLLLLLSVLGWGARTAGLKLPRERATLGVAGGALAILGGFIFLAMNVGWDDWGGLLLTIFLALGGIVLCFPFGVLAALGRRSDLPILRAFSVGYIELIRGVPLITLLFMGNLMIGLFLPEALKPSAVTRALIMITLFSGAYVAEIVRGGLQAVPQGQSEAAQALGLPKTKEMRLIVLPQALRNVIPALVGQAISLFKDTSLVVTIGLRELLGITQVITKQPDFNGTGIEAEVLIFAAFVYWVIAFTMSRESQRLESRLGVGTR